MSTIDNEIEKLEKQLAVLKKAKDKKEDLCNKKGNFYITVLNNDETFESTKNNFSTFNELKQFWESPKCKLKKTDFISLTYLLNGEYKEYEAHVDSNGNIIQKEFEDIVRVISTLDLWQLLTCEFAICNKKDIIRHIAYFRSDKLIEIGEIMDSGLCFAKTRMTEEEYWKKIDEGKEYRLFENN